MHNELAIRNSTAADSAAVEALYARAFPDEDLIPLIRELIEDTELVISLIATIGNEVAGHGLFTCLPNCRNTNRKAALLGPLAVDPARQRAGIGSAIVQHGLQKLEKENTDVVFVLGDPGYYSRFGFMPESYIAPPYSFPEHLKETELWLQWKDAWQSVYLSSKPVTTSEKLAVPEPWQHQELWTP